MDPKRPEWARDDAFQRYAPKVTGGRKAEAISCETDGLIHVFRMAFSGMGSERRGSVVESNDPMTKSPAFAMRFEWQVPWMRRKMKYSGLERDHGATT